MKECEGMRPPRLVIGASLRCVSSKLIGYVSCQAVDAKVAGASP